MVSEAATFALGGCCFLFMTLALRQVWLGGRRLVFAALAIVVGLVGFVLFASHWGGELGIPIAFAVASPIAMAVVYSGRVVRPYAARVSSVTEHALQASIYRDAVRIFAAVLLPLIPALSVSAAIAILFPAAEAARVVVAAYALPVVWAGFMAWAISARRFRPLYIGGIASACAGAVALLPFVLPGP